MVGLKKIAQKARQQDSAEFLEKLYESYYLDDWKLSFLPKVVTQSIDKYSWIKSLLFGQ